MRQFSICLAFIFFLFCPPSDSAAHTAPSGWAYDRECCSDHDCAPVPDATITVTPAGFLITLAPGQHHMLPAGAQPLQQTIPFDSPRVRVSGDNQKHVCLSPVGYVYCIYIPPGGV